MEEKKLNNEVVAENAITDDTEIDVGMIEESILFDKELHKEQHVWLLKGSIWKTYSFSKILDLIKRLQNGIKEYETLFDISNERKYRKMFNEEWKKEYQKELDKQGEGVIAGFPDFDLVYKLYFDQKAEIERLTEELKNLDWYKMWHKKFKKEIDDLTLELETYRPTKLSGNGQCKCSNCGVVTWTDWFSRYKGQTLCNKCLKERYGVEVE